MACLNGTQESSRRVVNNPQKLALETEARKATELLKGKVVSKIRRYRLKEVCIEFSDGTWLFVDHGKEGLELSVTKGSGDVPSC